MRRYLVVSARCLAVWLVTAPGTFLGWPLPSDRVMDWCDRQLDLARRRL